MRRALLAATVLIGMLAIAMKVFSLALLGVDKPTVRLDPPSGPTLYLYENGCGPPDSQFECRYYGSEIRAKLPWLPVTREVFSCRCYFDSPVQQGGVVLVPLIEDAQIHRILEIDPKAGKVIRIRPDK